LADQQSKIDIGDGQTIRQENTRIILCTNLNEVVSVENDTKINEAISIDWSKRAVHINAPLKSYETVSELSVPVTVIASKVSHSLSEDEVRECATIWNNTTKNWS
jgi:2-succinyl-5-enolpyruvyl-6-hydroxy-3-cyclohexene-1-carboxylate synthase